MAGKKLLVADDSLTIQKVIRLALSNEGYEIQAISDGAEAIQQISTFRPDAILIDVSLPTRSAFEIKREVNGMPEHAATRFVLMSSAFEKIDDAQAEEVGFDGHLTKPFDPAHLRQILSEVLAAPPSPPETDVSPEISPAVPPPVPIEPTSLKIQFDPPADFPPSDFELVESTRTQLSIEPTAPESPPPVNLTDDELWGKHEETPPPTPPMMTPSPDRATDRDEIRELTESTIRMSGLADLPQEPASDFEWKVNEPSLKPPSSLADMGDSSFHVDLPPPPPSSEMPGLAGIPGMPRIPETPGTAGMLGIPGMEDAVRRQVQETLEKMAREILPEVAERVIKAEINRLLNEKP